MDADKFLHREISHHVNEIRQLLSEANIGSSFTVTITATGKLNSSEPLKIAYKVSEGNWGAHATEGNALRPVTEEFLRRLGWNKAHSPVLLAAPDEPELPVVQPPPAPKSGTMVISLPGDQTPDA